MIEIVLVWSLAGAAAALYVRALRGAQRASPPMPALDSLDTASFPASVRVGSWSTGQTYSDQVVLDRRHLVLVLGKRHRGVLRREDVTGVHDAGVFGWLVEHGGTDKYEFGVRRRDSAALRQHLERHGWPVREGLPPGRSIAL